MLGGLTGSIEGPTGLVGRLCDRKHAPTAGAAASGCQHCPKWLPVLPPRRRHYPRCQHCPKWLPVSRQPPPDPCPFGRPACVCGPADPGLSQRRSAHRADFAGKLRATRAPELLAFLRGGAFNKTANLGWPRHSARAAQNLSEFLEPKWCQEFCRFLRDSSFLSQAVSATSLRIYGQAPGTMQQVTRVFLRIFRGL